MTLIMDSSTCPISVKCKGSLELFRGHIFVVNLLLRILSNLFRSITDNLWNCIQLPITIVNTFHETLRKYLLLEALQNSMLGLRLLKLWEAPNLLKLLTNF